MKIKHACIYCGKTWETESPEPLHGGDVSHGICEACSKLADSELDSQVKQADDIAKAIRGNND